MGIPARRVQGEGIVPSAETGRERRADRHHAERAPGGGRPVAARLRGVQGTTAFLDAVAAGVADFKAERVVDHKKVKRWLESWGTICSERGKPPGNVPNGRASAVASATLPGIVHAVP